MTKNSEHLSENLEDYLEAISVLADSKGGARPSDIAQELNVTRPSVTAALNSLARKGLVSYEKYKPVSLTKEGKKLAESVQRKHVHLKNFFTDILGVDDSSADEAACKIEHAVNDSIMKKLKRFLMRLNPCNECRYGPAKICEISCDCPNTIPLSELNVGERALVLFAGNSDEKNLVLDGIVEVLGISKNEGFVLEMRGSKFSMSFLQLEGVKVKKL